MSGTPVIGNRPLGPRTMVVSPTPAPRGYGFATLAEAFAAITDAAANKRYLIVVVGQINEPATVTVKDHIDVELKGNARVTITGGGGAEFTFSNLTDVNWIGEGNGVHLDRNNGAGTTITVTNCGSGVTFGWIRVQNTGGGSAIIFNSGNPILTHCWFRGGDLVGQAGHGVAMGAASPMLIQCEGIGGNGLASSHGLSSTAGSPIIYGGTYTGGGGGTGCHGMSCLSSNTAISQIDAKDTTFVGGGGAFASCHGIFAQTGSVLNLDGCQCFGGDGGNTSDGINVNTAAVVAALRTTFRGGAGGTGCRGMTVQSRGIIRANNCVFLGGGVGRMIHQQWTYDSGTPNFIIHATKPYRIIAVRVRVITGTPGGTFRLYADAGLTVPLTAANTIAGVGFNEFPVTGMAVIGANAPVYVGVAGGPVNGAFVVDYTAELSIGSEDVNGCHGVYLNSTSGCRLTGCEILANAASNAMWHSASGRTSAYTRVAGCNLVVGSRDTGRPKAVNGDGLWNPAPFKGCTVDGGSTNTTLDSTNAEF